jgi:hypothetical protein
LIQGYDQDVWAAKLHYQKRPLEPSLAAFKAARESTAQLFELMSEEDWRHLGLAQRFRQLPQANAGSRSTARTRTGTRSRSSG